MHVNTGTNTNIHTHCTDVNEDPKNGDDLSKVTKPIHSRVKNKSQVSWPPEDVPFREKEHTP